MNEMAAEVLRLLRLHGPMDWLSLACIVEEPGLSLALRELHKRKLIVRIARGKRRGPPIWQARHCSPAPRVWQESIYDLCDCPGHQK